MSVPSSSSNYSSTTDSETPVFKKEEEKRKAPPCLPSVFGYHRITVEPALVLIALSRSLSGAVLTQLLLVRTCEVTLGINSTICDQLVTKTNNSEAEELENKVQPDTAVIQMTKTLIEACIPAALSLFLGPWSDKYGRKLLMVWPLMGHSAMFWVITAMSTVRTLPPDYLLLASLPVSLSGGFLSIIASAFSFMSDITLPERRSFRMGMLDASLFTGYLVGTFVSAHLFTVSGEYGYVVVFGTCGLACLIAALYILFFVQESVPLRQGEHTLANKLKNLFDWHLLVNMLRKCCQKREHYGRTVIFLVIAAVSTSIITMDGEASVSFLFTRKKFEWDIHQYTTYSSVSMLLTVTGTVLGVSILSSWLIVPDTIFALIAFSTKTASTIIYALSPADWFMYLGCSVGCFGGVTGPLSRSILSKTVPKHEVGTIFSLTSTVETLMPLASAPLYTLVYNATFLTLPGAFYFVSTAIYSVDVLLISIVIILWRISPMPNLEAEPKTA